MTKHNKDPLTIKPALKVVLQRQDILKLERQRLTVAAKGGMLLLVGSTNAI